MVVVEPGAVADAVNVTVAEQDGLQLAGVNALAVTPVGRTVVMLKVTAVVTPDTRVAEAVSTPLELPPTMVRVAGVTARLKSKPAGVTTRLKVAVRVTPPPTAWIVIVVVEPGAVADAVKVTVAEHVGLQLAGENALAETPVGNTVVILKVTAVETPATRVAVAVSIPPAPPLRIVRDAGVAARLKSNAAGVTTRLNVAVRVTPPPTAWIVMVVVEPGAVADAVKVTVAEHVGLQLAGVKALAVTPVGRAVVMLKVTAVVARRLKVAVRVPPPPTAWIVIVVVEAGAVADAVKVTVAEHDGLQLAGVNTLAETPVGSTVVILKVTAVVTPAISVAVAVSIPPAEPPTTVRVAGVAARLKSNAAGVTTRLKVAVLVTPPPTAWIVIVVVEPGAVADAVKVTVAEHVGLQLAGVKVLAVTPDGRTVVILKVTAVVTPATKVAVAVSTPPAAPPTIVRVAGVAARLKLNAAGVTTRLKVAVRVTPPPTAWMVIVVVEPGAVADAVNVTVAEQVGLQLAGENALAETPVGRTVVMLKVTAVVTPATRVAVAVSMPPAPPPTIVNVAGVAARLKSKPAGVTTRLKVAVRVTPPPTA